MFLPVASSLKYPCDICSGLRSSIRSLTWHTGKPYFGTKAKDPSKQDPWLFEVQNEMRAGHLSEDNWNVLRGRETSVPASLVGGACRREKGLQNFLPHYTEGMLAVPK
jgi:hypothetical protein